MCGQNLKGGIIVILFLCFMIALNVSYLYEIYFADDFWWDEDSLEALPNYIIGINCLCAIVCLMRLI